MGSNCTGTTRCPRSKQPPTKSSWASTVVLVIFLSFLAAFTSSCGSLVSGATPKTATFNHSTRNGPSNERTISLSSSLPSATAGSAYTAVVSVRGGQAPYQFSVPAGELPPGLNLDSGAGLISGTPTVAGTYAFTVDVRDVQPNDAGQGQLTIVVAPPANHPLVSISVSPSSANILSAGTQQFTATVSNASNMTVAWSASSGTITADGLYTAPVVNSDTSVTITGTSLADSSKQMSVAIAVKSQSNKLPVSISLSPGKATVSSGGAQQFTANVSNTANTAASWWASAGKISSSGLLTAPVVETNTSIQVTVTSLADSSKQATATVTVNPVVAPPSIQI